MDRRSFLKHSCGACLAGSGALAALGVASCSSPQVYVATPNGNSLEVPLSRMADTDTLIVRPGGWRYDIALRRRADGSYVAFQMRCTHADNPLVFIDNGFSCNLHGSRFDGAGHVIRGPARIPLETLPIAVTGTSISISHKP